MKHFFRAVVFCFLVLIGLIIFGRFQPNPFTFERSHYVSTSMELAYSGVENTREMALWAPYLAARDIDEIAFTGAENDVGSIISWRGAEKPFSVGTQEIRAKSPPHFIQSRFISGVYEGALYYGLSEDYENSEVILTIQLDIKSGGFPYFNRVKLFMNKGKIEREFDAALIRHKTLIENSR